MRPVVQSVLLLTLSVPDTLGFWTSFDSGENCEANGCTTPSSAEECQEALTGFPEGTAWETHTSASNVQCNYFIYKQGRIQWSTTGKIHHHSGPALGCDRQYRCVCKCQDPPPLPPSPPPASPPEALLQPGPDGTFFVHGVYQWWRATYDCHGGNYECPGDNGVVTAPYWGAPRNYTWDVAVHGPTSTCKTMSGGSTFCDPHGVDYDLREDCSGTDFFHKECGSAYNGQVDCKHTCGLHGAHPVGARSVCDDWRCGFSRRVGVAGHCQCDQNGVDAIGTYGELLVNIYTGATWGDRVQVANSSPFWMAGDPFINDIIGSTPETFPILYDAATEWAIQCQCEPNPSPPAPPPSPPIISDCSQLKRDGASCGAASNGAICHNCCSGVTGTCGADDGTGPWCGADNLAEYSYAKIDPRRTQCGVRHFVTFQPKQCFVDAETSKQHCIALPTGLDINGDDPRVAMMKKWVAQLDAK